MAANVSNYIAAGNAAVKNTYASLAAARDNAPKYDKIAAEGIKARTKEKIAAMKADMDVERAKIKSAAELETVKIELDEKKSVAKSNRKTRFAGKIAAAGAAIATTLMPASKIIKPTTTDFSGIRNKLESNLEETRSKLETIRNTPIDSPQPAQGNQASGVQFKPPEAGSGWDRMSRAIRFAEGTSGDRGYTTMFGGGQFSDMSRHPDTVVHTSRYSSAAAGAYQFMPDTWEGAQRALNLPDFSRESQEKAGRYLTEQRGVNPDAIYTNREDFGRAIDKLSKEWAGLPTLATGTSYYGQGGKSLDQLWAVYNQ